jgi:hypothetical protein
MRKYIRLYSDQQLKSAIKILDPFQWDLWKKFESIDQLDNN